MPHRFERREREGRGRGERGRDGKGRGGEREGKEEREGRRNGPSPLEKKFWRRHWSHAGRKTAKHIIKVFHCRIVTPFYYFYSNRYGNIQGGQKRTVFEITLQRLMIEKHVIRPKFQNFVYNEMHKLHISAVNYSLPNLRK